MLLSSYTLVYFRHPITGQKPISDFLVALDDKARAKVLKTAAFLIERNGYLDEPFSRHVQGKLRELRVQSGKLRIRVFYFLPAGRKVVLLHCFLKSTPRTPLNEIATAVARLDLFVACDKS